MVKCIVKIGTLQFEQKDEKHPDGIYQQFDEFEVSAERAKLFDPNDVKIIPDSVRTVSVPIEEPIKVEAKPLPQTIEKAVKAASEWGPTKKKPTVEEAKQV